MKIIERCSKCPKCGKEDGFVYYPSIGLKSCNNKHRPVWIKWSLKDGQKSVLIEGLKGG